MPAAAAIIPIIMQIAGMIGQQSQAQSAQNTIQDVPFSSTTNPPWLTQNQPGVASQIPYGTGTSSVSPYFTQIDPTLTGLRQSLLQSYQGMMPEATGLYGGLLGQNQNLMTQAGQNSPGFINAQIAPLQQQIAQGWGDLVLGQQQRGIRGSSLADTQVSNFSNQAGTALSNATANAQQQSLGLQGNLLTQQGNQVSGLLNAQSGILGAQEQINTDQLKQELSALGLSQQSIELMLARQQLINQAGGAGQAGLGSGLMGIGNMLPGLLGSGGSGGGGGGTFNLGGAGGATSLNSSAGTLF